MEPAAILVIVTLILWCAGWLVLGGVRLCGSRHRSPEAGVQHLSIIIPARNEEFTLPRILTSIAAQSVRPGEVVVVDDDSTDRTADTAREHGAKVISSQSLPDGWRGKTWACHQGAQAATGDWLLFLDADTWFEPDGLTRILEEFSELSRDAPSLSRGAGSAAVVEDPAAAATAAAGAAAGAAHTDALQSEERLSRECASCAFSVAPHHEVQRLHEQFSAFFNLVMLAGTGAFTLRGDALAPRGLLGQFLLIERAAYERVGGHEAVKGRILENFWLAEQLRAAGVTLRCRTGRGVFAFRMYPNGWRELIEGWTKGFAGGAGQTPPVILWLVVLWMIGLMLAPLAVALDAFRWLGVVAYALCAGQVGWMLRQVGSFHWLTALLYPLPLVFYFVVFTRSVWRAKRGQRVEWKGRQIGAG